MPIAAPSTTPAAPVAALVPAQPGATVTVGPVSGPVIAWALVTDPLAPGGARVDPVWIAGGRTWTPDQHRAATGGQSAVCITAQ